MRCAVNPLLEWLVRPVGPSAYARRMRSSSARTVVVCAGDSITHGLVSANYVAMLADRFRGRDYQFVNAGVTSDLAWNLAERLDPIVACHPDIVTILVGTNDAAAQIDASWRAAYVRAQRLPQEPSLTWFAEELRRIILRLRIETPARIALLTIPPIGEDLDSRYNALVAEANRLIAAVGEAGGVTVLPLHDRFIEALPRERAVTRFDGTKRLIYRALLQRFVLRRSWDGIVRRHGRTLLTDDLHLGDRAGQIVAGVIEEYLQRTVPRIPSEPPHRLDRRRGSEFQESRMSTRGFDGCARVPHMRGFLTNRGGTSHDKLDEHREDPRRRHDLA